MSEVQPESPSRPRTALCSVARTVARSARRSVARSSARVDPRLSRLVAAVAIALSGPVAAAPWHPDAVFVQAAAGEHTQAISGGAQWQVTRAWRWSEGVDATGHLEVEIGRWRSSLSAGGASWAWVSQFSLVPVLRWSGAGSFGWYAELGIGPSYLTPVFQSRDKRFSSRFQFRDHLSVGRRWGSDGRNDLSVRLEHFSNAGIERPNPGINRLALRYTRRF